MSIKLVTNERIAETSSKGNQEKWRDPETNRWYKLDQFGYEGLAETMVSLLLEKSNLETDTAFTFVRYQMETLHVHGLNRTGCSSPDFLEQGQSLITINRLLTSVLGFPLSQKLAQLSSDKQRIAYLAEFTMEYTGLEQFPQYLTLLFEVDALFCNDDRHLNNIAVLEKDGKYSYCPIFDNGAGLLSNTMLYRMDIAPKALISQLRARPFGTTFTRQRNTARNFYGQQLSLPLFQLEELREQLTPLLDYYPARDRGEITDRVATCILQRQKT